MSTKTIDLDGIGSVQITKRRGQKTIRLTIRGSKVRITQPTWVPYGAGENFAKARIPWIKEHLKPEHSYQPGDDIAGKVLSFVRSSNENLSSKVTDDKLIISLPSGLYPEDERTQHYIRTRTTKLLRDTAEDYLPKRTAVLASMHNFTYKSVQVRKLKSRWGSCNSKKELVFNINLMQLDPLHIDYVILHELTHTIHMHHGVEFWDHMESVMPGARRLAKIVRRINNEA